MRKWVLLIILIYSSMSIATTKPRFEMGIMVGDPVGLSLKWWYFTRSAFDLTAGWSFPDDGRLSIQFDYLFHFLRITSFRSGEMPLYTGIGMMLRVRHNSFFGARIPIGFTYLLKHAPLSFFAEAAPHVEIVPEEEWGADGGVGMRIAF